MAAVTVPSLALFPLNDTFKPKVIALNQRIKIGRQTSAKTVPNERNGYFDTKVLSRQHAEIWEEGGKIWIKDVKSSNGTFINGVRLSPEGVESDPHSLHSGDTCEFGIDILGEDNQSIIHHKVASRVTCVLDQEDVMTLAHPSHPHNAPIARSTGIGTAVPQSIDPTTNGHPAGAAGYSFRRPSGAPQPPSQQTLALGGMGAPTGFIGGRRTGGPGFEHILSRLQNELTRSREAAAELHTLAGTMGEIQDSLASAIPPTTVTHLPSSRPLQNGPESGILAPIPSFHVGGPLGRDAKDIEIAMLTAKVDEMRQYADAVRDVVSSHAELRRELGLLKQQMALQQTAPRPLDDIRPNGHASHGDDMRKDGRPGAVSPIARLLERDDDEDDGDDARSIATVIPMEIISLRRAMPDLESDHHQDTVERTLSWVQDPNSSMDGWPDEPPPLASVPPDIAGATRGDVDPEPMPPTMPIAPSPMRDTSPPLSASPPSESTSSTHDNIIPGTGLSLRRRGTVKPRARLQIKKERLNGSSPTDPKEDGHDGSPPTTSSSSASVESFVIEERNESYQTLARELQEARESMKQSDTDNREALLKLEDQLMALDERVVAQGPTHGAPSGDELAEEKISRSVALQLSDARHDLAQHAAELSIGQLRSFISQELASIRVLHSESSSPKLEDIEGIVLAALDRHGVASAASHVQDLTKNDAQLARLLAEREEWQQERRDMLDTVMEFKAIRDEIASYGIGLRELPEHPKANGVIAGQGVEHHDTDSTRIASPSRLSGVTNSIFRQRGATSGFDASSPPLGNQKVLATILLALCALLFLVSIQPLGSSVVVAALCAALAWWSLGRDTQVAVQA
ncbi:hypothetical protein BKA62DRAFT_689931 [Auriculariales sp. MPI-PUGE-AT-0066]|nr:hypothetical protein BKA62DRAFT_689931 [Auriculariales sp. MPI-PUGE-AT-0066]